MIATQEERKLLVRETNYHDTFIPSSATREAGAVAALAEKMTNSMSVFRLTSLCDLRK